MWYNDLRPEAELTPNKYRLIFIKEDLSMSEPDKKRTLENLIELKKGITAHIPNKYLKN